MWHEYDPSVELKTGDILKTENQSLKFFNLFKHYAIVFKRGDILYVSHSTKDGPEIITFEDFAETREIFSYFRDSDTEFMTDEYIERKTKQLIEKSKNNSKHKWDFVKNNCEDYVKNICPDCKLGLDNKTIVAIAIIATLIITIIVIVIWNRKRK